MSAIVEPQATSRKSFTGTDIVAHDEENRTSAMFHQRGSLMEMLAFDIAADFGEEGVGLGAELCDDPRRSMFQLMKAAWAERCMLGLAFACTVVGVLADVLMPQLVGVMMDIAIGSSAEKGLEIRRVMLLILAIRCAASIFKMTQGVIIGIVAEKIALKTQTQLFRSLLSQEVNFFHNCKCGDLMARVTTDIQTMQIGVSASWVELVSASLRIIITTILIFATTWKLAMLMLLMLVMVACVLLPCLHLIGLVSTRAASKLGESMNPVQEVLENIKTVRACGSEVYEVRRFGAGVGNCDRGGLCGWWPKRDGSLFRAQTIKGVVVGVCCNVIISLSLAGIMGIMWYGVVQVVHGEITLGQLTAFVLFAMNTMLALLGFSISISMVSLAAGAASRIFPVIDREPEVLTEGPGIIPESADGSISLSEVHFAYGSGLQVLNGLSMEVPGKTSVAFVGGSGCGKSTALSLLARFYFADSGTLSIDGVDIRCISEPWLREHVAVVQQEPVLFSMSVRDNIRYTRAVINAVKGLHVEVSDDDVEAAAREAHAHDFICQLPLGYNSPCGSKGGKMSGGQKQRIAIARALIAKPTILLLDEATSALDSESEHLVQESIARLQGRVTTVSVAHRLSTIRNSDRIFVMESGLAIASGTHEQLMESCKKYKDLVQKQTCEVPQQEGGEGPQPSSCKSTLL